MKFMNRNVIWLLFGITIIATMGGYLAYYISALVHTNEGKLARNSFEGLSNRVVTRIISELDYVARDMTTATTAVDEVYKLINDTSFPVPFTSIKNVILSPLRNSRLTIFSMNYVRPLDNSADFTRWIEINRILYNKTDLTIFNLENGTVVPLNVTDETLAVMSMVIPNGNLIGVPNLGLWNIRVIDPVAIDQLYTMNRSQYNPGLVNSVARIDGSILRTVSLGVRLPPDWLSFVVFSPTAFLDQIVEIDENVGLSISDETSTFYTKGITEQVSLVKEIAIDFPFRQWTLRFTAAHAYIGDFSTESYNIVIGMIVALTIMSVIIVLTVYRLWAVISNDRLRKKRYYSLT